MPGLQGVLPGLRGSALHWAGFLFASEGITERMGEVKKCDTGGW